MLTQHASITIPLAPKNRARAEQIAAQYPHPEQAEQAYLNTLAVEAVKTYLDMMDIPFRLEASYSSNPLAHAFGDVADLYLPGRGRLECRPMPPKDLHCHVPEETWSDRLGYIVTQISDDRREGKILGFVPQVDVPLLSLNRLQSLDAFLEHLDTSVCLVDWVKDIIPTTWETIQSLTQRCSPALAFRTTKVRGIDGDRLEDIEQITQQFRVCEGMSVTLGKTPLSEQLSEVVHHAKDAETRWKASDLLWKLDPRNPAAGLRRALDLGLHIAGLEVALMMATLERPDGKLDILLRTYPMGAHPFLPQGLQLDLIDDQAQVCLSAQARSHDDYMQMKLTAESGDRFSLKITLGEASLTEHFLA